MTLAEYIAVNYPLVAAVLITAKKTAASVLANGRRGVGAAFRDPLGVLLALWLAVPALRAELVDLGAAITTTFADRGLPAAEGWRVAHAGGPAAVIVLVLLLPFLLLDKAAVLLAPGVLWAVFVLAGTAALMALTGAFVLGVPALCVALRAFVLRTRRRWKTEAERESFPTRRSDRRVVDRVIRASET